MLEVRVGCGDCLSYLFNNFASKLISLMDSKDAPGNANWPELAGQEYENLCSALEIDLKAKVSIIKPHQALSQYLKLG
jgi:hypothetical protein